MYETLLEERRNPSFSSSPLGGEKGGEGGEERGGVRGGVSMEMHNSVVKELVDKLEVVVKEAKVNNEIEQEKIRGMEEKCHSADAEVFFFFFFDLFFFFCLSFPFLFSSLSPLLAR